jgi:membrane protease YdiL (CAAX protease family)
MLVAMNPPDQHSSPTAVPEWPREVAWPWPWAVLIFLIIFASAQAAAAVAFQAIWSGQPFDQLMMPLVLVAQIAMAGLTWLAVALRGPPARLLLLGAPDGGTRRYFDAFAVFLPLVAVTNLLFWLISPEDMAKDFEQFRAIARAAEPMVPVLAICIGAPIAEELLFRGFLLPSLAGSRLGFWPAALITSAFWAAMHWNYSWLGLAEILVIGVFFSWLLRKTNSLRIPMFWHAAYNSALFLEMRYAFVT